MAAKANFKRYREILRNSIKRAKMLYYKRTFNVYQNDMKNWTPIKEILQQKEKKARESQDNCNKSLSGIIGLSLILTKLLKNLIHISLI